MKATSEIIHHASKQAYHNSVGNGDLKSLETSSTSSTDAVKGPADQLNSKAQISNKSQDLNKDAKKNLKEKLKSDTGKVKKAAKHLLRDGAHALKGALSSVTLDKVPLGLVSDVLSLPDKFVSKVVTPKQEHLSGGPSSNTFFISGLDLSLLGDDHGGLENLSRFTELSNHYSWSDEDEVLEKISLMKPDEKLMIIGHSLGGDTAVSLANRLNTPKYGFRKIDLLVTLDSIGFDNDIIPENVRNNQNYISDQEYFFNDGPNIARNYTKSRVQNYLRDKLHTELDSDPLIQAEILESIKNTRAAS